MSDLTTTQKKQLKDFMEVWKMSKRDLFAELTTSLNEAKEHSEGKLTLKTHEMKIADELVI